MSKLLNQLMLLPMVCLSVSVQAAGYDFKPGMWETTTTMEVKGLPPEMAGMMNMPPRIEKECVKHSELMFVKDEACKFERNRINANKMQVTILCVTGEGSSSGKGEIHFNGKHSSGWFEMTIPQGPADSMSMKRFFEARYLGACP